MYGGSGGYGGFVNGVWVLGLELVLIGMDTTSRTAFDEYGKGG